MNKPLIILPFDHRGSFLRDILKVEKIPTWRDRRKTSELKQIIFDGFLLARRQVDRPERLAILVDEEYGQKIIRQAKNNRITISLPVEKSQTDEFQFDYGAKFYRHIKKFRPDYVKALVRYNPGEKEKNRRQLAKLKTLSDYCRHNKYPLIFELLVPPTDKDLKLAGSRKDYDRKLRAGRTAAAIKEIRQQVKTTIWKLEGFDDVASCRRALKSVGQNEKIIVLGRGENKRQVESWLAVAKNFPAIIGFAIGRTIFLRPLQQYVAKKKTKKETVAIIAKNFRYFIDYWDNLK